MKFCNTCDRDLPLDQFRYWFRKGKKVIRNDCRKCEQNNRKEAGKPAHRQHTLAKYGLTELDFANQLAAQNGVCALCGGDNGGKTLHVDHHHQLGYNRQLLCGNCNRGIGLFKENPQLLRLTAVYLEYHREKHLGSG